ncbi:unnamed protein product [Pieris macdunnoughi]|uniref:ATP-dependent DNA helicase n=1 Tax=Pieris macdunnoughi TaxID=345717 RepID=A0A821XFR9_9NEOP|nr:unnamed protein product [Pieris macdunnoughi]
MYDIKVDESFFNYNQIHDEIPQDDFSEHIPVEDSLTAQQQTLLWNEEHYLRIAPGEDNVPQSLLFDEHAEELSFPAIYLGQFPGCGKTFVIKLIMEIYNRYNENDGCCNSYIACASTGKAAVAIDGTTVHTALKISLSRLLPLSTEVAHQYRALFKYVKVLIIDEISMIGAELLSQIDSRLKQITGDFKTNFGGLDVILIGDLRQLPPVRATPIYKQQKQKIVGPILWRGFRFFELDQVMRQANQEFSSILTKIGNGQQLNDQELILLESRFVTMQEAEEKCPHGIRLFNTNKDVTKYNNRILSTAPNKTTSIAKDVFVGCTSAEQTAFVRQKLYKMSLIDTGGLPYETVFVPNVFYMITTNIDVSDGLANGAVGKLVHLEFNDEGDVNVIWLDFPDSPKIVAVSLATEIQPVATRVEP